MGVVVSVVVGFVVGLLIAYFALGLKGLWLAWRDADAVPSAPVPTPEATSTVAPATATDASQGGKRPDAPGMRAAGPAGARPEPGLLEAARVATPGAGSWCDAVPPPDAAPLEPTSGFDVDIPAGAVVAEDVVASGSVRVGAGATVHGEIRADGRVVLGPMASAARVRAGRGVVLARDASVLDVESGGTLELAGGSRVRRARCAAVVRT